MHCPWETPGSAPSDPPPTPSPACVAPHPVLALVIVATRSHGPRTTLGHRSPLAHGGPCSHSHRSHAMRRHSDSSPALALGETECEEHLWSPTGPTPCETTATEPLAARPPAEARRGARILKPRRELGRRLTLLDLASHRYRQRIHACAEMSAEGPVLAPRCRAAAAAAVPPLPLPSCSWSQRPTGRGCLPSPGGGVGADRIWRKSSGPSRAARR